MLHKISTWRVKHWRIILLPSISICMCMFTIYFLYANVIAFSYGYRHRAQIKCYQSLCWFTTLTFILIFDAKAANLARCGIRFHTNLTYIWYEMKFMYSRYGMIYNAILHVYFHKIRKYKTIFASPMRHSIERHRNPISHAYNTLFFVVVKWKLLLNYCLLKRQNVHHSML